VTILPVFLDANTLVPINLTDLLLRLAEAKLIEVFWSKTVLADAMNAVKRLRPELPVANIAGRFADMAEAFPEAMVSEEGISLADYPSPDPDDRLVMGCAHRSPADLIITSNLVHFPTATLNKHGLWAQRPDTLLLGLMDSAPDIVVEVLHELSADMKNPPLTVTDVIDSLASAGMPRFADVLRAAAVEF
jgi:predicted nucleic acid-binding protein